MMQAGGATLDSKGASITIEARSVALPDYVEPYRYALSGRANRKELLKIVKDRLDGVREGLAARGLVLQNGRLAAMRWGIVSIMTPALLLGIMKILVGSER